MRHLWNTKLFILFLILTVSPVFSLPSPRVEIETPLAMTLGLTEIPLDDHDTYSLFLPYFAEGPLRARYIFRYSIAHSILSRGVFFMNSCVRTIVLLT